MADLPLPKAVKSRSLEGIYPKWPNFPKIVLSRPGWGGGGVENQNKTTSTQHHTDCASGLRSGFSLQSASHPCHGRTPGRTGGAPLRTPTHLPRPGSSSRLLPVAALATATTPLLRSPPTSNHIQASECRSPLQRESPRQQRWRPGDLHGLPLSSLKLALFSRAQ